MLLRCQTSQYMSLNGILVNGCGDNAIMWVVSGKYLGEINVITIQYAMCIILHKRRIENNEPLPIDTQLPQQFQVPTNQ